MTSVALENEPWYHTPTRKGSVALAMCQRKIRAGHTFAVVRRGTRAHTAQRTPAARTTVCSTDAHHGIRAKKDGQQLRVVCLTERLLSNQTALLGRRWWAASLCPHIKVPASSVVRTGRTICRIRVC